MNNKPSVTEDRIPESALEILRQTALGKKVRVENEDGVHVGRCTFIGYNPFLPSWGLQLTVGNKPVMRAKLSTIEVIEES